MRVYGITGGIGVGKSSVTEILRELGYSVIDLDQVARDVVEPGTYGLDQIIEIFGAAYISLEGMLDRKKLAALVFNDEAELAKLDELMGPLLWAEVERQRDAFEGDLAFVDGALIIEKKMHEKLDGTILVTAPMKSRLPRVMARDDATAEQILARIGAQMSDTDKRPFVDFVIDNAGTLHELRGRTVAVLELLRR